MKHLPPLVLTAMPCVGDDVWGLEVPSPQAKRDKGCHLHGLCVITICGGGGGGAGSLPDWLWQHHDCKGQCLRFVPTSEVCFLLFPSLVIFNNLLVGLQIDFALMEPSVSS